VAQNVESRGGLDSRGHSPGVQGIADAESWLEGSVGNTSLGPLLDEIKNGRACCFAACSCGGWDGNEGLERLVHRQTFAQRRIDEVEEVGVGVCSVKVHELGRVYDGSAADGQERVGLVWPGPCNCVLNAIINVNMSRLGKS
jgi:hypothetical protein